MVLAGSVEKARWLRDLQRFLPLRSQFVLSGNTRDLQIHEPIPGTITAVPLARALPDALKEAGYQQIASFDLLNGEWANQFRLDRRMPIARAEKTLDVMFDDRGDVW